MRWEYVDRSQSAFHHLWTANPDGTGQMVYYGNQRPYYVMLDAKPLPETNKVFAVFSPGHGQHGRSMQGVSKGEIEKLLVLETLPKPVNLSGGMWPISAAERSRCRAFLARFRSKKTVRLT